jgi:hypothetical protein
VTAPALSEPARPAHRRPVHPWSANTLVGRSRAGGFAAVGQSERATTSISPSDDIPARRLVDQMVSATAGRRKSQK